MKRVAVTVVALAAVLGAYWAWPFLTLKDMAADVQARNAPALSERIDFVRLRRSLAQQIVAAYLRVTGRARQLGAFGNVVAGIGASVADPIVSQIVNPENLVKLLGNGSVATDFGDVSFKFGSLSVGSLASGWRAWLNSEYGFGRFSIGLPVNFTAADQFRLRMEIIQWRWKLTGLDLPERLQVQLAQELAKKYP